MSAHIDVLDHGYVRFTESWGSDECIIESARQSTQKGFLGWGPVHQPGCTWRESGFVECLCGGGKPGDEKLLEFLFKNGHCYDAATEVLTRRGFIPWPNVRDDDELGQWDRESDSLVYEHAKSIVRQFHAAPMYRVEHGGVDLLVTPGHKMLVKRIERKPEGHQGWGDEWQLVTAEELGDRSMVRYRKHAARRAQEPIDFRSGERAPDLFPDHDDTRALLRLIGFFIGDGHAGANGIVFHLRVPRKIAFLREVCLEVGWELHEGASDHFVVRGENITSVFRAQFYAADGSKKIPGYLLDLCVEDAEAILDGLRESDGTVKRGAWEYSSTSKQVADAVQLLVLHAGGSAHIHTDADGYLHRVMVLSRMLEPVVNQGKRNTRRESYDGLVFCAHTRTGVLVVRRNGKIVLSGNSTPFEFAGMTIEVQAPIFVFREWHRHRTQSYSEASARYAPLPDVNYVPSVERLMMQNGANKQAASTGATLVQSEAEWFQRKLREHYAACETLYQAALASGVPKELARAHLPVGRYSKMRASTDLWNWLKFLKLREASNAQHEIRVYANAVNTLLTEKFPRTMALYVGGEQ